MRCIQYMLMRCRRLTSEKIYLTSGGACLKVLTRPVTERQRIKFISKQVTTTKAASDRRAVWFAITIQRRAKKKGSFFKCLLWNPPHIYCDKFHCLRKQFRYQNKSFSKRLSILFGTDKVWLLLFLLLFLLGFFFVFRRSICFEIFWSRLNWTVSESTMIISDFVSQFPYFNEGDGKRNKLFSSVYVTVFIFFSTFSLQIGSLR